MAAVRRSFAPGTGRPSGDMIGRRSFVGHTKIVDGVLTAILLLPRGHCLAPGRRPRGLGKTMLVRPAPRGPRTAIQPHPVHARPDAGDIWERKH